MQRNDKVWVATKILTQLMKQHDGPWNEEEMDLLAKRADYLTRQLLGRVQSSTPRP